jgi:hypothetical protein
MPSTTIKAVLDFRTGAAGVSGSGRERAGAGAADQSDCMGVPQRLQNAACASMVWPHFEQVAMR